MKNKYLTLLAASSFAFFMQACGDDSSSSDPEEEETSSNPEEIASSDAAVDTIPGTLYMVGSDYKTGEIRWMENDTISSKSVEIYQDTKLIAIGAQLFALERSGSDNIALIDTKDNKVSWETALDDYSNPSDIVDAGNNEAWVGLEGAAKILKVSLEDGKTTKTIETDAFTTEGGTSPNAVDLEVSGDTLFAVFQRYVYDAATWTTTFPKGLLAMYKLSDGTLLDTVQLATKNPMAVKVVGGNVYVATQGEYNTSYGTDADDARGIEKIDLDKLESSLFISGEKLGGGISALAADYDASVLYAAVYKAYGDVPVAKVDISDKSVNSIEGIADAEGGLAIDAVTGILYIGDRTYGSEAVYSYDGEDVAKVPSAAESALAPYSLAIVK